MSVPYIELVATCGTKLIIDEEDYHLFRDKNISLGVNKLYGIFKDDEDNLRYVHREVMRARKGEQIDHKNMNTFDNRKSNLRVASMSQNRANQKKNVFVNRDVTSGYKGVCFDKANQNYLARVSYEGKVLFTGRFENEVSAALAYNFYAKEAFGEFARLNEIPDEYSKLEWRKYRKNKDVSKFPSGYHYISYKSKNSWLVLITVDGEQRRFGSYRHIREALLVANDIIIKNGLHKLDRYSKKIQKLSENDVIKLNTEQREQYNEQLKELKIEETDKNEEAISIK